LYLSALKARIVAHGQVNNFFVLGAWCADGGRRHAGRHGLVIAEYPLASPSRTLAVLTRSKRTTVTFCHPFTLKGVDRKLAPGTYEVVSDEELIQELSFPVYRRVSTLIFLPAQAHRPSSIEMVNVDPADLNAAHAPDLAQTTVS
jgi:hypothetical protein